MKKFLIATIFLCACGVAKSQNLTYTPFFETLLVKINSSISPNSKVRGCGPRPIKSIITEIIQRFPFK